MDYAIKEITNLFIIKKKMITQHNFILIDIV